MSNKRPKQFVLLLTSAGRRVELMQCFRRDAASLGICLRVIAADAAPDLSPACRLADRAVAVPRCTAPDYIPELQALCAKEGVKLIVPTIDTELGVLASARAAFEASGVKVAVSGPETIRIARDKLVTAETLQAHGLLVPKTCLGDAPPPPDFPFPALAKPRHGSASQGIRVVQKDELGRQLPQDYVLQELIEGEEYTVNFFIDRNGRLRSAVPHLRQEVRAGEVSKSTTCLVPALARMARLVGKSLPDAYGPLCFQARRRLGQWFVFEINARFGGGFPLAHQAGARYSLWLLQEALGLRPSFSADWQSGLTMLRYDQSVFVNQPSC